MYYKSVCFSLCLIITLTVLGCSKSGTPVDAPAQNEVIAQFTHSAPDDYASEQTIFFDASASKSTYFKITEYTWDWGDGSEPVTFDVPTAFHIFTTPLTFNVELTVTDQSGSKGISTKELIIFPAGSAPIAEFIYDAPNGWQPGSELIFNATASYDPDGDEITYTWDWGDGEISENLESPVTTHVFNSSGESEVRLTVTDASGWETESDSLRLSIGYPDGARIVSNRKFGGIGSWRCYDVKVIGDYLYAAIGSGGLRIFDITDPANPDMIVYDYDIRVSSIIPDGTDYFYTDEGDIFSLQDPLHPVYSGKFQTVDLHEGKWAKKDNILYVSKYVLTEPHIKIIDVTNPASTVELGQIPFTDDIRELSVSGNTLIANARSEMWLLDISDPADPVEFLHFLNVGDTFFHTNFNNGLFYLVMKQGYNDEIYLRSYDLSNPISAFPVASVRLSEVGEIVPMGDLIGIQGDRLQFVDISNPWRPEKLAMGSTIYDIESVEVDDSYAFIAEGYGGLSVMDLENLESPYELINYGTAGHLNLGRINDILLKDGLAYITNSASSLIVLDMENIEYPIILTELALNEKCTDLQTHGNRLFCMGDDNVYTFDISTPGNPVLASKIPSPQVLDYTFDNNYLYTTGPNFSSLIIHDITDLENPEPVSSLTDFATVESVALYGNYAFLGASTIPSSKDYSLITVDVSDPQSPAVVNIGEFDNKALGIVDLEVTGDMLLAVLAIPYGYYQGEPSKIRIYDITNPVSPVVYTQVYLDDKVRDLSVYGDYAYFQFDGVSILNLNDPSNPMMAAYLPTTDNCTTFGIESDIALVGIYDSHYSEYWLEAYKLW